MPGLDPNTVAVKVKPKENSEQVRRYIYDLYPNWIISGSSLFCKSATGQGPTSCAERTEQCSEPGVLQDHRPDPCHLPAPCVGHFQRGRDDSGAESLQLRPF